MKTKLIVRRITTAAAMLLAVAGYAWAATTKAIKSTRLSDYQVIVSCTNGSTPAVHNVSGSIVLSCEGRVE